MIAVVRSEVIGDLGILMICRVFVRLFSYLKLIREKLKYGWVK